jgi:hypothetical protein
MVGPYGIFEHAEHDRVRQEHGYCVDDVARVLLVAAREIEPSDEVITLARVALSFLQDAQDVDGTFRNRRLASGEFVGQSSSEDCWGRAVWALGTTVARFRVPDIKRKASELLEPSLRVRSSWPRSMAFAVLGAVEVLVADPTHSLSLELVKDGVALLDRPVLGEDWLWTEERLSYANAVLPEALMAASSILESGRLLEAGLAQLRWLLSLETTAGHLSVTSSRGRHRTTTVHAYDQQPIEVAALCDACSRAWLLTGDPFWELGVDLAAQWFLGKNDGGVLMFDPLTGGGYDGLTENGPNLNQGAESTLALLSTLQSARQVVLAL